LGRAVVPGKGCTETKGHTFCRAVHAEG
jgi:hypothetical protein